MKRVCLGWCLCLFAYAAAAWPQAAPSARKGWHSLSSHAVVYPSAAEAEEGIDAALYLQQLCKDRLGETPRIVCDTLRWRGPSVVLEHDESLEPFGYRIEQKGRSFTLSAGGCWALRRAAELLVEELGKEKRVAPKFVRQGTVMGEQLFPLAEGANLRILDDNIWDYSAETIPDVWQKAGVDPRDDARAPQFAQLVRAYMPDILTLQEYSTHMHARFYPLIQQWGYVISYESGSDWNNTPIFYNPQTVEQLYANYVLYTPAQWSNAGSKSFTSAVFRHKATGKTFAVLTTHLWFKGEKKQAGSDQARAAQVRLMLAEAAILKAEYGCPIFVTGDMNCYESSTAMLQFFEDGFVPCYRLATQYADLHNGHHICSPSEIFSRKSRRPSKERSAGAIDHCLLRDEKKEVEVKVFDCVQAYFTVKLTDHYPNVVDAKL